MAIDKKLIFWKKQSTFNAPIDSSDTNGSVLWYSIVFFKDTGKIWTNGTYYNCTDDWENITNKPNTFTPSEHNHDGLTPFVAGTQLATTGSWTGIASSVGALYDGLTINYWLPYSGSGNATLNLTLKGGGTTGAINCYYGGTSRLTTHYGAGNIIKLTYRINANVNGTAYTGWWADANYDTSDNYTHRYYGAFKMGSAAVAANNIIGSGANGLMVNVMTTPFKAHEPIYWTGSAYSANQAVTYGNVYESHFSCSISGTGVTSLVMYQPIYLKGTINNGLFTTNSITQTTPTTDDGFYYIFIGYPWNTTNSIGFSFKNWIGVYKNGAFKIFSGYSESTGKLATSVNITVGDSTKSFDGASALAFTLAEIGAAAINQTMYIGTTAVPINRSSGALSLSGVSIDGNAATATYAENSSKLYSIDTTYKYGGGSPYYGYLSYTGSRWRFQMSPATPAAIEVAYADVSGSTVSAQYLPTKYDGGVKTNPQDYFSNTIGLRVAMTGAAGTWTDTLWINGYSGGDVLSMCALHTSRQGSPKMWISNQNSNATTYGTLYEFITTYNVSSHALPIAGGTLTGALTVDLGAAAASPLALKSSGVTTTMGSLNGSWFHMGTAATNGFYFYQNVQSAVSMTAPSFIKTGSSDSYVLLGGGGQKAISDFTADNRNKGVNTVTTLASLPITKRLVYATITSGTNISLSSTMEIGDELHIIVYNSSASAVTQVLPNTGAFVSMSNSYISIPAFGYIEINIICHATGSYIIRAGGISW